MFYRNQQPYLATLYKSVLSTMYFGLFRIGEVTESDHVIKAKDVHIGKNKKKLMFILHSSKTHTPGVKPQIIKITSSQNIKQNNTYCPFKLLQDYIQIRKKYKTANEQFFVFRDRSPLKVFHLRIVL